MVMHRQRHYRTQFRKLGNHAPHWLASNLATAPSIKYGRRSTIAGWGTDGSVTLSAVTDTSVAVVRVPGVFMGQIPGVF